MKKSGDEPGYAALRSNVCVIAGNETPTANLFAVSAAGAGNRCSRLA